MALGVAALAAPFTGDLIAQSIGTQAAQPSGAILNAPSDPRLQGFRFRSIGPALTSGRVTSFAVHPNNRSHYYVGVASGGVWKTTNAGVTFTPVFDNEGSYSVGHVTLDPKNPNAVWVGTGETTPSAAFPTATASIAPTMPVAPGATSALRTPNTLLATVEVANRNWGRVSDPA